MAVGIETVQVERLKTAPEVWAEIFFEHGVALIACAGYEDHLHGTPSKNKPDNLDTYDLCELWSRDKHPELGGNFAVSSLVTTRLGDCFGELWTKERLWKENLYEQAFLCLDFDCPNTPNYLAAITRVLERSFGDWYLLKTDRSFHLVIGHLIPPKHVPFHCGKLLTMFASETDEESGGFFLEVGRRLMQGWFDLDVVRWSAQELLANVKHYDEPNKKGYVLPLDGRYMGHALWEWMMFLQQREMGFGFLRVSGRGENSPPVLKARRRNGQVVVYETR